MAAVQRSFLLAVARAVVAQRCDGGGGPQPLAAHQLVPFGPFSQSSIFLYSCCGLYLQEAGRSCARTSTPSFYLRTPARNVMPSRTRGSASALRRTARQSKASPGDRVALRKKGVCRRPGQSQGRGKSRPGHVQVADRSQTGRGQVTDRSRTSHIQVADRSQTGRGQVADRSQTGRGQVTDKDGSANHLLRSYAESTLGGWHFWS